MVFWVEDKYLDYLIPLPPLFKSSFTRQNSTRVSNCSNRWHGLVCHIMASRNNPAELDGYFGLLINALRLLASHQNLNDTLTVARGILVDLRWSLHAMKLKLLNFTQLLALVQMKNESKRSTYRISSCKKYEMKHKS